MKLISMTEFVLELSSKPIQGTWDDVERYPKIVKYARFIRQPLTLGMFGEEGVIINIEGNDTPYLWYVKRNKNIESLIGSVELTAKGIKEIGL